MKEVLSIEMNIKNESPQSETTELIKLCRDSVRRISHELIPPEFNYATIDEVVRYHISKLQEAYKRKINIGYSSSSVKAKWTDIPAYMALNIYRIIQEAVGDALKHSGAVEIEVSMKLHGSNLEVMVKDNGKYKLNGAKGIGL